MTSTPLSRIDPTKLYPPFFAKVQTMLAGLEASGVSYFAVSGFRTYAEQDALFAQGRSTPGPRVTQAHGGESAHCFGCAVDFTRDGYLDRAGLQPDFRPESYAELGVAAKALGLAWGGDFGDRPHVGLAGYVTAVQLAPLRAAYESGGLLSVFKYLDQGDSNG